MLQICFNLVSFSSSLLTRGLYLSKDSWCIHLLGTEWGQNCHGWRGGKTQGAAGVGLPGGIS